MAASSIVCPTPTGHSHIDALNMYKKKQKEMPGLTPAAWRKAAAQEMGLDYNTYLALWKQGKEAAKAVKMVAESTPTLEAAVSPGPKMGIPMKKAPPTQAQQFSEFADAVDGVKGAYSSGDLDFQDAKDVLMDMTIDWKDTIPASKMDEAISAALKDMDGAELAITTAKQSAKLYEKGLSTLEEMAKEFKYLNEKFGHSKYIEDLAKDYGIDLSTGTATAAADVATDVAATAAKAADEYIQTHLGPLNHDLAQSVYKKMKIDMPGATPATLRHAAADYLKVPYDDYLAAWKKPGVTKIKAEALPANTTVPLSPSPTGKYAKANITNDQLKNELVRLYGPGANPAYMVVTFDSATGQYAVILPQGLLNKAAQEKVIQGLKDLGLDVNKIEHAIGSGKTEVLVKIKSPAYKVPEAPKPLSAGNHYNTTTLGDGVTVLDMHTADEWTRRWWNTVSKSAQNGVKRYTTNAYRKINTALRRGEPLTGDMKAMQEAMPLIDKPFTVFRGCGDEVGRSLTIDAFKEGKLFEDPGFMSTAVNEGAAWRGVRLIIDMPKGTRGMYVDYHSSARGELEFLLGAGTKFRVKSVVRGSSPYSGTVHLTVIP